MTSQGERPEGRGSFRPVRFNVRHRRVPDTPSASVSRRADDDSGSGLETLGGAAPHLPSRKVRFSTRSRVVTIGTACPTSHEFRVETNPPADGTPLTPEMLTSSTAPGVPFGDFHLPRSVFSGSLYSGCLQAVAIVCVRGAERRALLHGGCGGEFGELHARADELVALGSADPCFEVALAEVLSDRDNPIGEAGGRLLQSPVQQLLGPAQGPTASAPDGLLPARGRVDASLRSAGSSVPPPAGCCPVWPCRWTRAPTLDSARRWVVLSLTATTGGYAVPERRVKAPSSRRRQRDDLSRITAQVHGGALPDRPNLVIGQQGLADATRTVRVPPCGHTPDPVSR